MIRRIKSAWIAAGIAVLGATFVSGLEARAGTVALRGGIRQGSGTGGDPPFTYYFDLFLTDGSITPDSGSLTSTFTVEGLVGVSGPGYDPGQIGTPSSPSGPPYTAAPGSPQASEFWITPNGGVVTTPSPVPPGFVADGYNYQSDVTWEYLLGPTYSIPANAPPGTEIYLGQFTVNTSWSYAPGQPYPLAPGTVVKYTYDVDGTAGGGTLILAPEPSSVVLMLLGAAVMPLTVALRRRRVRSRCVDG